ncbi:MAG: hypothetical protein GKR77_00620 [Legionellales bacterium]|nr:hypothetical protein [Legionellales bacterium]
MKHSFSQARGVSVLEMSVALVLGTGLTLLMLQLYQTTVLNSTQQWQQLQWQKDGLRLTTLLQQAVNNAGFIGCPHWGHRLPVLQLHPHWRVYANEALKIYQADGEQQWQPALPIELQGKVAPGTDVLQTVYGQGPLHHLLAKTQASTMILTTPAALRTGDRVMVADCTRAVVAQIAQVGVDRIQLTRALPESFSPPATVVRLQQQYFFINRRGALAWQVFDQNAQAVMEAIAKLRIRPLIVGASNAMIGIDLTLWQTETSQPWQMQLGWFNHPMPG